MDTLLARQINQSLKKPNISSLNDPKKQTITNPLEIANAFSKFYSSLYNLQEAPDFHSPTEAPIKAFLDSINTPLLTPSQQTSLSAPFTEEEVPTAIYTLLANKPPSPNGYINEYCKAFATTLAPYISEVANQVTKVTLLPK